MDRLPAALSSPAHWRGAAPPEPPEFSVPARHNPRLQVPRHLQ